MEMEDRSNIPGGSKRAADRAAVRTRDIVRVALCIIKVLEAEWSQNIDVHDIENIMAKAMLRNIANIPNADDKTCGKLIGYLSRFWDPRNPKPSPYRLITISDIQDVARTYLSLFREYPDEVKQRVINDFYYTISTRESFGDEFDVFDNMVIQGRILDGLVLMTRNDLGINEPIDEYVFRSLLTQPSVHVLRSRGMAIGYYRKVLGHLHPPMPTKLRLLREVIAAGHVDAVLWATAMLRYVRDYAQISYDRQPLQFDGNVAAKESLTYIAEYYYRTKLRSSDPDGEAKAFVWRNTHAKGLLQDDKDDGDEIGGDLHFQQRMNRGYSKRSPERNSEIGKNRYLDDDRTKSNDRRSGLSTSIRTPATPTHTAPTHTTPTHTTLAAATETAATPAPARAPAYTVITINDEDSGEDSGEDILVTNGKKPMKSFSIPMPSD